MTRRAFSSIHVLLTISLSPAHYFVPAQPLCTLLIVSLSKYYFVSAEARKKPLRQREGKSDNVQTFFWQTTSFTHSNKLFFFFTCKLFSIATTAAVFVQELHVHVPSIASRAVIAPVISFSLFSANRLCMEREKA